MTIVDYFDRTVDRTPDRVYLQTDEGRLTYRETRNYSVRVAAALQRNGLELGERVGVLAPNTANAVVAMLGLWRAGATWVPLNARNAVQATVDFMNEVGCSWLFVHSEFAADVEIICAAVPSLQKVICIGDPIEGHQSWDEFVATGSGHEVTDWSDPFGRQEQPCAAWPTGGTTGASKAVLWTNHVWSEMIELATRTWPVSEHPVNLMVAPITHAAGAMAIIYAAVGGTVVVRPGFDAADTLDHIERHGVTHLFLPPTAFYALLTEQEKRPRNVSTLRMLLLAAAPVSPDKLKRGVTVFGPCIAECWGQAEAPFLLTYLAPEEVAAAAAGRHPERLGSCGRPTIGSVVEVMNDAGKILPRGEHGELVARGRLVTPGYFGRPDETAEIREFGWHHTGDIGYKDDDGYLYIVDRKKDMIITGGFNVYPAEIEAALLALPQILECAVIGVPDEKWGEAVLAAVVPEDSGWNDSEFVISYARAQLGPVKAPKQVVFFSSMPRTPVGKTDKRAMKASFWTDHDRAVN